MFFDLLSFLKPVMIVFAVLMFATSIILTYLFRQHRTKIEVSKWLKPIIATVSIVIIFFVFLNIVNADVLTTLQKWQNGPLDSATVTSDLANQTTPAGITTIKASATPTSTPTPTATPTIDGPKPYIAVISKGFQHQYWQVVKKGAEDAAAKYGATMTFDGPASESEIAAQVTMLDSALAKKPAAICLASLSTDSVTDQLNKALAAKIPVIGFDSGVPGASAGLIVANASTDNKVAGALAATNMYPAIQALVKAAAVGTAARIAVVSLDSSVELLKDRNSGFIVKMVELLKADGITSVAIVGNKIWNNGVAENDAAVIIDVSDASSISAEGCASAAASILNKNPIAIFGNCETSAVGILDATEEGATLGSVVAVGFDAGIRQKTAVRAGYFLGSVTQDPYNIGFKAVELAYKAFKGEAVANVDTGCKFYTKNNIEDPYINDLVYD